MKKLIIALAASAVLGGASVPASAQGVYGGVDDGYRWGGPTYSHRFHGPRAYAYVHRDRPHYSYRRYYRHWDDGYRSHGCWTCGPGDD